jgi:hypothetical protein
VPNTPGRARRQLGVPVGSAAICFSGAISGLSAHFTTGSSQLMHWRSVRPDKVITGTRCFPHLGQCVIGFMRSLPIFLPVTRNCSFCSIRAFGHGASVPALLPPHTIGTIPASTKAGDASRRGGNGEQPIEIACRGANTHQEARAASAPHSSAAGIAREKLGAGPKPRAPAHSSGWTGGIVEAVVVAEGCAAAAA